MTNYEKIKSMSKEQMAEHLYNEFIYDCSSCPCDKFDYTECYSSDCDCVKLIGKWLSKKDEKEVL
jgi:hypothetical protein